MHKCEYCELATHSGYKNDLNTDWVYLCDHHEVEMADGFGMMGYEYFDNYPYEELSIWEPLEIEEV